MVEFFKIVEGLERPFDTVNQAAAAIRQAHLAAKLPDPTSSHLIKIFKSGIARSLTTRPSKTATPVDAEKIQDLFLSWSENEDLDEKKLRSKAMALIALAAMLRPMEITLIKRKLIKFRLQLEWIEICLLGFKTGFGYWIFN